MQHLLCINIGSSGLKFGVFAFSAIEAMEILRGSAKHGDDQGSVIVIKHGDESFRYEVMDRDIQTLIKETVIRLRDVFSVQVNCIVHRLVHGGPDHKTPVLLTNSVIHTLEGYKPLAPSHLPAALAAIQVCRNLFPGVQQVGCFDTAFHRYLPVVAQTLPINQRFYPLVQRYGFHGLSYEYVFSKIREGHPEAEKLKIIIAHLGSGASMAAIADGKCVETTMGFTPEGGLMMSSRTGDIDPGLLLYLLEDKQFSIEQLKDFINKEGGIKGVAGVTGSLEELIALPDNEKARLAVQMFCYHAKKHLGALIAVLGGLDLLVFTGGIGENIPLVREKICSQMKFAGIEMSDTLNRANSAFISDDKSKVKVVVIKANEELQMARNAIKLLNGQQ
jgi:acetate kinase